MSVIQCPPQQNPLGHLLTACRNAETSHQVTVFCQDSCISKALACLASKGRVLSLLLATARLLCLNTNLLRNRIGICFGDTAIVKRTKRSLLNGV
jgi:hypothetical protein